MIFYRTLFKKLIKHIYKLLTPVMVFNGNIILITERHSGEYIAVLFRQRLLEEDKLKNLK